jgi:hypothetical protein
LQDELQEVLKADAEAILLDTLAGYERTQTELAALQDADTRKATELKDASEFAQAYHTMLYAVVFHGVLVRASCFYGILG